jgi:Zn-finger nucleic acid-binding protein
MRSELDKKRSEVAKQQRKETHWMKCPKCGTNLAEINYQNVMIDTCSECKGIWLDQGELDLIGRGKAQVTKRFFKNFSTRMYQKNSALFHIQRNLTNRFPALDGRYQLPADNAVTFTC